MTTPLHSLHNVEAMAFLKNVADLAARGGKAPPPPVLTVSRDEGSGGEVISDYLAEALGVPCLDRELFDRVAALADTDPYLLESLQENTASLRQEWMVSLFTGQNLLEKHYRQCLVDAMLGTLETGGIIIGRGGHVVLARHPVFRVRIVGSTESCARRLAAREGIDEGEAARRVEDTNHRRAEFVWHHFQSRINNPTLFDLIVNTDRLDAPEAATRIILDAHQAWRQGQPVRRIG